MPNYIVHVYVFLVTSYTSLYLPSSPNNLMKVVCLSTDNFMKNIAYTYISYLGYQPKHVSRQYLVKFVQAS